MKEVTEQLVVDGVKLSPMPSRLFSKPQERVPE